MKIRQGFVSNSSSSSFCIFGAIISAEKAKKFLDEKNVEYDPDYICETFETADSPLDLECWTYGYGYDDDLYIGRSWDSIKDDETGKEFKDSIEKKLKEAFGDDVKVSTHEEAWYDG